MKDLHDILKIRTNNVKPARGKILISEPFMFDYYFKRSVILLAEHNEEGSFGVIINKPISARLNEVVKGLPDFDTAVYLGGPVQSDSLFFIHTLGEKIGNSMEIMPGLYWGGDLEEVQEMITLKTISPGQIRFFVGYSGWAPKQLDGELKRNSWVVSNIEPSSLFEGKVTNLWNTTLHRLGGDYAYWTNFPDDPGLN